MPDGSIRKTARNNEEIFATVLQSLESHRPSKSETSILGHLQKRFNLPANRNRWPQILAKVRRTDVDEFLKIVLALVEPFVEMMIELYDLLYRYVSTSGGRTEHFEINSDELANPWPFDTSRMPREIRWIRAWDEVSTEEVEIQWKTISSLLRMDNGIFYGEIQGYRLIQSLIVLRRDGRLSADMQAMGDQVRDALHRALRAWHRSLTRDFGQAPGGASWQLPAFVPQLNDMVARASGSKTRADANYRIGIELDVVTKTAPGGYSLEQVLRLPEPERNIGARAELEIWPYSSAAFFCALWGLDEASFFSAAGALTEHENRPDLLSPDAMRNYGASYARDLVRRIEEAIKPTGKHHSIRELRKRRLDILLLPYWKDRWFLYEVWTLIQPLARAVRFGAKIKLVGVSDIDGPVLGQTWNLPTQKAKSPVASLNGKESERELLVWSQRETRRLDSERNMEPDVRITFPWKPYPDLAIIECKDRVRFRSEALNVVRSYLDGSAARDVWLVNYEISAEKLCETRTGTEEGRHFGVVDGFRPGVKAPEFWEALDAIFSDYLGLSLVSDRLAASAALTTYLILDCSGSMNGRRLRSIEAVRYFVPGRRSQVMSWSGGVEEISDRAWKRLQEPNAELEGSGAENGAALCRFVAGLSDGAKVVLLTDGGGLSEILSYGAEEKADPDDPYFAYTLCNADLSIVTV